MSDAFRKYKKKNSCPDGEMPFKIRDFGKTGIVLKSVLPCELRPVLIQTRCVQDVSTHQSPGQLLVVSLAAGGRAGAALPNAFWDELGVGVCAWWKQLHQCRVLQGCS